MSAGISCATHGYEKPQLVATAPNQLWSWDITRLMGPSKGGYSHLYVIIDFYSRFITGWMIADRESTDLATRFIPIPSGRPAPNSGSNPVN